MGSSTRTNLLLTLPSVLQSIENDYFAMIGNADLIVSMEHFLEGDEQKNPAQGKSTLKLLHLGTAELKNFYFHGLSSLLRLPILLLICF